MPASWLYKVDLKGLLVAPEFMERVSSGERVALHTINRQRLTLLYRKGFSRESRRPDAEGLFWSSTPPLHLIPFVRGGRHSPPAWIKEGLLAETVKPRRNTWQSPKSLERAERSVRGMANLAWRHRKRGEQAVLVRNEGGSLRAWNMKPNPKFDLVVVNRHDRAALLKLLGELDSTSNVESWLAARTERGGATYSRLLHADYSEWCTACNEVPTGSKSFAQALVGIGVQKLTRSGSGERYGLTLK